MNYLMCSVGRRAELIKDFRKSIPAGSKIVATDNSPYAPALYLADKQYTVPRIDAQNYMDIVLDICRKEQMAELKEDCWKYYCNSFNFKHEKTSISAGFLGS